MTATPGLVSAAEHTPQAQRPTGRCLSSHQRGSGTRFPPQLLFHLLSGLATLSGINIKEDYSRQLQV